MIVNVLIINENIYQNKKSFPDQEFYLNMIKMLVKPHYALDCTCQCAYNQKQRTGFSTDTSMIKFKTISKVGKK